MERVVIYSSCRVWARRLERTFWPGCEALSCLFRTDCSGGLDREVLLSCLARAVWPGWLEREA